MDIRPRRKHRKCGLCGKWAEYCRLRKESTLLVVTKRAERGGACGWYLMGRRTPERGRVKQPCCTSLRMSVILNRSAVKQAAENCLLQWRVTAKRQSCSAAVTATLHFTLQTWAAAWYKWLCWPLDLCGHPCYFFVCGKTTTSLSRLWTLWDSHGVIALKNNCLFVFAHKSIGLETPLFLLRLMYMLCMLTTNLKQKEITLLSASLLIASHIIIT